MMIAYLLHVPLTNTSPKHMEISAWILLCQAATNQMIMDGAVKYLGQVEAVQYLVIFFPLEFAAPREFIQEI